MKQRLIIFAALLVAAVCALNAETRYASDGISPEMLGRLKAGYNRDASAKALRNALAGSSIDVLALNSENRASFDDNFSHKVKSRGITDQKRSGRCWLFTGLKVHPPSRGGQYTGLSDNISKYGVVPAEVMAESFSAENTSRLNQLLSLKLREYGLELRRMPAAGGSPPGQT